ncbi:hypothetical protein SprV_1002870400 [Sparganum proliferum]
MGPHMIDQANVRGECARAMRTGFDRDGGGVGDYLFVVLMDKEYTTAADVETKQDEDEEVEEEEESASVVNENPGRREKTAAGIRGVVDCISALLDGRVRIGDDMSDLVN